VIIEIYFIIDIFDVEITIYQTYKNVLVKN